MLHIVAIVEDITIVATRGAEKWDVQLSDNGPSGGFDRIQLTDHEFACVMFLTTGEDKQTPAYQEAYSVVEPKWKDCIVRPFP